MIRGDKQVEGVGYHEPFALVAKMVSVRYFLSVAATKGWDFHQMDGNNAFLHVDIEEDVYIALPLGFKGSHLNQIYKLHKSLYGLK